MLHILSQLTDQSCAVAVARYLVVYMRRGGDDPQLSPWLEGRNHIHPAVHRVQDAIAADLAKSWNLSRLAKIAGAGTRHLSRLFNENVGMSIKDYITAYAWRLLRNCSVRPASTWNAWQNELALPLHASCGAHGEGYTRQPLGKHETALIPKPPHLNTSGQNT